MAKYDLDKGDYDVHGARFGVVASRYNASVVEPLLTGALQTLAQHGVAERDIVTVRVPGAFEIPLAAQRLAARSGVDAVITLGAVIRGGTPHFEFVAGECARGVMRVALDHSVPVIFGVLTADDTHQALERAGGSEGNKGHEAALAALETVHALRHLVD